MAGTNFARTGWLALGAGLVSVGIGFNAWVLEAFFVSDGVIESRWIHLAIAVSQLAFLAAGFRTLVLARERPGPNLVGLLRRERPFIAGLLGACVLLVWGVTLNPTGSFGFMFGAYAPRVFGANLLLTVAAVLAFYVSGDPAAWRKRTANVALSAGSVGFVFLALELPALLGWLDYRTLFVPHGVGFDGPHNRVLSPEGFYHRPPLDHFTETRPGDAVVTLGVAGTGRLYSADYAYDEHGFRNRPGNVAPGVVFVGDSFVEGYRVGQADTLTERFAALSGQETFALGQADFSPYHELSALRTHLPRLRPQIVVWFVYEGNDLLLNDDSFGNFLTEFHQRSASYFDYDRRSLLGNLSSFLANWSTMIAKGWASADLVGQRSGTLRGQEPGPDTVMYFEYRSPNEPAELPRLDAALLEAKAHCERAGVQLLLARIPVKLEVYREEMTFPVGSEVAAWGRSRVGDHLAAWGERNGVPFVDLKPALKRAAASGRLVYFLDDAHWSPEGHDVVAREIGRRLLELGWLPAGTPMARPH